LRAVPVQMKGGSFLQPPEWRVGIAL